MLETSIEGARSVLMNVTGGTNMSIVDINEAAQLIIQAADNEANIIFGAGIDEALEDEIRITVIATGFEKTPFPPREPPKKPHERERERAYGTDQPGYGGYTSGWRAPVPAASVAEAARADEPDLPSFVNNRTPAPGSARPLYREEEQSYERAPVSPPEKGNVGGDVPAYLRRPPKR
jgi:cell division protein FtsZ